ncbi:MAG: hypothetical protein ACK5C4_16030 [Pseudanabaena sp.]
MAIAIIIYLLKAIAPTIYLLKAIVDNFSELISEANHFPFRQHLQLDRFIF